MQQYNLVYLESSFIALNLQNHKSNNFKKHLYKLHDYLVLQRLEIVYQVIHVFILAYHCCLTGSKTKTGHNSSEQKN